MIYLKLTEGYDVKMPLSQNSSSVEAEKAMCSAIRDLFLLAGLAMVRKAFGQVPPVNSASVAFILSHGEALNENLCFLD